MLNDRPSKDLASHMAAQLRVRQGALDRVAARAGRKVPTHVRRDLNRLIEADHLANHAKLRKRLDPKTLKASERRVGAFLETRDPARERRNAALDMIAQIAFVVVSVALALFFYLLWRGAFS